MHHPKETFFSNVHGAFTKADIQMSSDLNNITLETDHNITSRNSSNIWKVSYTHLNNP